MSMMLVAALQWLVISAAHAQQAPVPGAGATTCDTWTKARKANAKPGSVPDPAEAVAVAWVMGYLRGAADGLNKSGAVARHDAYELKTYLDQFCAKQPGGTIYNGATEFAAQVVKW